MKTLVIYDSNFGNTKLIAETVGTELGHGASVKPVTEVAADDLKRIELLVVGSPINGWRPTVRMLDFLSSLHPGQLTGCRVAAFDTRVNVFFHGNAVKRLLKLLLKAGGTAVSQPIWFFVKGTRGPLRPGEVERAREWAVSLMARAKTA